MNTKTKADWESIAADLSIEGRAFIDGDYRDAASGATVASFSPRDGAEIAQVAVCDETDADRAVAAARAVFERGDWSAMAPMERKKILVRWAEIIEQHAEELAVLETLDVGKPIADTTGVDVPAAVRTIRWTGEAIDKVYGEISPTPNDTLALIQRLPLGVIAAIVPWNFPPVDDCMEARPVTGDRQLGHRKTGTEHLADGASHCGARPGGRITRGRPAGSARQRFEAG